MKFTILNTILFGGEDSQRATPVPIPNTEVKSLGADGTAGVAQWESRSSPPFLFFCVTFVDFMLEFKTGAWCLSKHHLLVCIVWILPS